MKPLPAVTFILKQPEATWTLAGDMFLASKLFGLCLLSWQRRIVVWCHFLNLDEDKKGLEMVCNRPLDPPHLIFTTGSQILAVWLWLSSPTKTEGTTEVRGLAGTNHNHYPTIRMISNFVAFRCIISVISVTRFGKARFLVGFYTCFYFWPFLGSYVFSMFFRGVPWIQWPDVG